MALFSGGIMSLPFGHPYLSDVRNYKKESEEKLEDFFQRTNLKC